MMLWKLRMNKKQKSTTHADFHSPFISSSLSEDQGNQLQTQVLKKLNTYYSPSHLG